MQLRQTASGEAKELREQITELSSRLSHLQSELNKFQSESNRLQLDVKNKDDTNMHLRFVYFYKCIGHCNTNNTNY